MDFVDIFNVSLTEFVWTTIYFAYFSGVELLLYIVVTLFLDAVTCFLESS